MTPVLWMVLAAGVGVGVGALTQVARRRGRAVWRVLAGLLGLAAVAAFSFLPPRETVAPLALFTVVLVASYAWQPREVRSGDRPA